MSIDEHRLSAEEKQKAVMKASQALDPIIDALEAHADGGPQITSQNAAEMATSLKEADEQLRAGVAALAIEIRGF